MKASMDFTITNGEHMQQPWHGIARLMDEYRIDKTDFPQKTWLIYGSDV